MSIIGGLWGYIGGAAVALVGLIGLYFGVKAKGRAEARQEQEQQNAQAIVRGSEIRDSVRADGADAGRDWLRERYKRGGH